MKKLLCYLLTGVLLLSLTACKKENKPATTQPQTNPTQPATPPASTQQQSGDHTYTLVPAADDPTAKILTVTDTATQAEIQAIRLTGNEWFISEPIYTDITFDGHRDILVPAQRLAGGACFAGYIWVEAIGQYVHAPKLAEIPNIALDGENKLLLGGRTASQITYYGMYRYNGDTQDFEIVRSLYWEPDEGGVIVVEESQFTDGEETELKRFTAPPTDRLTPQKDNPDVAPYYAVGSLWDLGSDKWRNSVYKP